MIKKEIVATDYLSAILSELSNHDELSIRKIRLERRLYG
jgi:hypothetical protein